MVSPRTDKEVVKLKFISGSSCLFAGVYDRIDFAAARARFLEDVYLRCFEGVIPAKDGELALLSRKSFRSMDQ